MTPPPEQLYPDSPETQLQTTLRVCKKCGAPQILSNFQSKIKRANVCSSCRAQYHKEWVERNKEKLLHRSSATDPSQIRVCSDCGAPKPLTEFYKNKTSREGRHTACKDCSDKQKAEWNRNNLERKRETSRNNPNKKISHKKWREKNPDYMSKNAKEWREMNPDHVRRKHIEKRFRYYGVTEQWYHDTLAAQDGSCAICGSKDPKSNGDTFHVDHDHSCCNIKAGCRACDNCRRGLLCGPCNTRLGILENVLWKRKAIAYLNKYSKKLAVDPDQGSLFDF
jgi:Recombination endonuclease VII